MTADMTDGELEAATRNARRERGEPWCQSVGCDGEPLGAACDRHGDGHGPGCGYCAACHEADEGGALA